MDPIRYLRVSSSWKLESGWEGIDAYCNNIPMISRGKFIDSSFVDFLLNLHVLFFLEHSVYTCCLRWKEKDELHSDYQSILDSLEAHATSRRIILKKTVKYFFYETYWKGCIT